MDSVVILARGRLAVRWLYGFISVHAFHCVVGLKLYADLHGGLGTATRTLVLADGIAALLAFVLSLATIVVLLRWIYTSNKAAHEIAGDIFSISPGWSVGWFFVPILSWWMPFTGVRETYQASVDCDAPYDVPVPPVMRLWWGLVVVYSLFAYFPALLLASGQRALPGSQIQLLNAVGEIIAIAASFALIQVVRLTTAAQAAAATAKPFI